MAALIWFCRGSIADSRGALPLPGGREKSALDPFDPKQSAALFVGVRRFPYDATLAEVRYAVDDAIDLAFVLSLDGRVRLVEPARVILALSGEPQKPESKQNLERLVAAGAQVRTAGQADVLNALDDQARLAGRDGALLVAFATHGVSYDGTQYLLTATSVLRHRETSISEAKIRDIASRSDAARSLILVDACRERLSDDQRNGGSDRRSAAAMIRAMTDARGQAVLSAAAAGQYAYDDDSRRNGVFTAAVIDGLRCMASPDERGLITVDTLAAFVEMRVMTWIRKHRSLDVARATQMSCDGQAKTMPLASCHPVPAGRCTISIASAPTGAIVSIDGREIGSTPVSIGLAEGQQRNAEMVKAGYEPLATVIDCRSPSVFSSLRPRFEKRQVLLTDAFDDNRHKWYTSKDPAAPARVENGVYLLGSKTSEFRFTTVPQHIDQNDDFQIAVTARWLSGSPENYYGLVWGLRDGNSFFLFSVNGRGNLSVGILDEGRGAPLNDTTVVHPSISTSGSNRLKVSKIGNRLELFVNDTLVHEMEYRPFFGPGVGLGAFGGPVIAAFDDLTIVGGAK